MSFKLNFLSITTETDGVSCKADSHYPSLFTLVAQYCHGYEKYLTNYVYFTSLSILTCLLGILYVVISIFFPNHRFQCKT